MCNPVIMISAEEAATALRAAATPAGQIHRIVETQNGNFYDDVRVEREIDKFSDARFFAFQDGPFKHDLAILTYDAVLMYHVVYRYNVPRPPGGWGGR